MGVRYYLVNHTKKQFFYTGCKEAELMDNNLKRIKILLNRRGTILKKSKNNRNYLIQFKNI
ncbi:MAG: hypothetical protein GF353_28740 [Candidatus Lokiarchaeota archaeon]|nr:hypothetical protein [Candidatus Lokiarchaeota archaeon]MBD3353990.1 hypothetical protein [Candidatus Lokiarchaeota archaeon]